MASDSASTPGSDTCWHQFPGDGPKVIVKATFLDIEAPPPSENLVRSKTAPECVGRRDADDSDDSEEGTTTVTEEEPGPDLQLDDFPALPDDEDEDVPQNVPLTRYETVENWEPAKNWAWGRSAVESVPNNTPAYGATPMPPAGPAFYAVPIMPFEQESAPSAQLAEIDRLPPPPPQTLKRWQSQGTGYHRVLWTVDAKKLKNNDKQAVSPPFPVDFADPSLSNVTFKMMLYPKATQDQRGGCSFKKARGRGYVQLKCEAELDVASSAATLSFRIGIGALGSANEQPMRGPVKHNFSQSAVCGLPKDDEEWDFESVVDSKHMTFVVNLEVAVHHL